MSRLSAPSVRGVRIGDEELPPGCRIVTRGASSGDQCFTFDHGPHGTINVTKLWGWIRVAPHAFPVVEHPLTPELVEHLCKGDVDPLRLAEMTPAEAVIPLLAVESGAVIDGRQEIDLLDGNHRAICLWRWGYRRAAVHVLPFDQAPRFYVRHKLKYPDGRSRWLTPAEYLGLVTGTYARRAADGRMEPYKVASQENREAAVRAFAKGGSFGVEEVKRHK